MSKGKEWSLDITKNPGLYAIAMVPFVAAWLLMAGGIVEMGRGL